MTTSDQPMDHVPPASDSDNRSEQSNLEKNVKMRSTWVRLFFFAFLYGLSRLVTAAVVVIQFFHVLFTGDTNEQLRTFGHSLAVYSFEVIDYLTFNSDTKPFPLEAAWPEDLPERARSDASDAADED